MTRIDALDRLRLEVERDLVTGELVNMILNPSGELGGWGWLTPIAGSQMSGNGTEVIYSGVASTANNFTTEPYAVTAGDYAAASWTNPFHTNSGLARARFVWYDSAGTPTLATQGGYQSASGDYNLAATVVPAGTVQAALRFDLYSTTGGVAPTSVTRTLWLTGVTMATATTATELGGVLHTNECTNPSFETNTTGWTTTGGTASRVSSPVQNGTSALKIAKGTGAATAVFSGMAVIPGQDFAVSGYVARGATAGTIIATPKITWINGAGADINSSVFTTNSASLATTYARAWAAGTAPAGAVTARITFTFSASAAANDVFLDAVLFEQSSTLNTYYAGSFYTGSTLPSLPPAYYTNILGESANISIERPELNLGTLTATVVSTDLDPANTTLLQPNRRVRALVNVAAAGDPEDWQAIFTGKTQKASVEYRLLARDEAKRAIISLTAIDAVSRLAQQARPDGVKTIGELPFVLEGCGVPWNTNGFTGQLGTATIVAGNDQAYAIDQIAVTRDTSGGFAWVDRNGILQAWDADSISTSVVVTLDEDDYTTDFGIDYATDRVINSVSVDSYEVNPATGVTETVQYGPYLLSTLKPWDDVVDKSFTVQGLSEAEIEALADAILAANGTPTRHINYVVLALTEETIVHATLDLYDLVEVQNTRANLVDDLRITTVTHTIEANNRGVKWLVRLDFAIDGTVAPPQVIPSPSTGTAYATEERGTITPSGTASEWTGAVTFTKEFATPPFVSFTPNTPVTLWSYTSISETGFAWRVRWADGASHTTAGSAQWKAEP